MKLISQFEAPPELRVQCEAFRILGSYKGDGAGQGDKTDQDLKELAQQLFDLCEKESDFLDIFIAANTLSMVRFNNTNAFNYIIYQLIRQNKIRNSQPFGLNNITRKYLYEHGINIEKPYIITHTIKDKELFEIISEDDLDRFIKYTLIQTPTEMSVKFETKNLEGSIMAMACALNAERIVRYLTISNKDFTSAVKVAAAFGNYKILRILEQNGASVIEGYDAAVAAHQYEIIDWMRFNYPDIRSTDNIELRSNNVLAFLTKEKNETTFEEAFIALDSQNIHLYKYLITGKEPPIGTNFNSLAKYILYLSISGEYESVQKLFESDQIDPTDTDNRCYQVDLFIYSRPEFSKQYIQKCFFTLDNYAFDMMASLHKVENAKIYLDYMVEKKIFNMSEIIFLLCIAKDTEYVDKLIEFGVDFSYWTYDTIFYYLLLFGTKDVDFTKYVLSKINIKPNFIHSLNIAIYRRNIEMIKFILNEIPNELEKETISVHELNLCYTQHHHPLQFAVLIDSIPIMEILLDKFDVNESSLDGITALHFAASIGSEEMFNYLIDKGANPYMESINGKTVLHCASISGSLPIVKKIIEITGKKLINKVDRRTKLTAISASIYLSKKKGRLIFNYLKENGADLDVKDVMSPLMCELHRENTDEDFVKDLILIDNVDVNIEVECLKGKANALHYAIHKKMNSVVRLLLEKGAKCVKPSKGEIPDIGVAIMVLDKDISMKMVKEERYIENTNYPAIAFAIARNNTELIDVILDQRPTDIECGYLEMTPLKAAVLNNDVYLVEKLLKMGANPFATRAVNYFNTEIGEYEYLNEDFIIFTYPPLKNVHPLKISLEYSIGSAVDLAFMKNNENVLKIFGFQGAAPNITSGRYPISQKKDHPYKPSILQYKKTKKLRNYYVPFVVDMAPPNAEDFRFGTTNCYMDNAIQNLFYELFNEKETFIFAIEEETPYCPLFEYI